MDAAREDALKDVLITIDPAKLPPPWADAVDVAKPVPLGIKFFERRIVIGDFLWAIALSAVFALLGVICVPMGVAMLWSSRTQHYSSSGDWWMLGFGAVMLSAAWIFAASLLTNWRTMRKQDRREPTRLGIFLSGDAFFEATEHGNTLIPRSRLVSAIGGDVRYLKVDPQTKADVTKSLKLPTAFVRDDPRAVVAAVEVWAAAIPVPSPGTPGEG